MSKSLNDTFSYILPTSVWLIRYAMDVQAVKMTEYRGVAPSIVAEAKGIGDKCAV